MGEVKWIKIVTDIFDDEKILLIESLPEADSIIVIWFKLLCLAGKQNNSGVFVMSNGLAYTDKMLATIFRRKEATVSLALKTFEQFGMIEIINDAITIPNWSKHQTLDQLEERKEYMRNYMQKYREKQKLLTGNDKLCEVGLPLNEWKEVLTYFEHKCAYCGCEEGLEQEHIVPVNNGGKYVLGNIVPSCRSCNASKGAKDLDEWYKKSEVYNIERHEKICSYMSKHLRKHLRKANVNSLDKDIDKNKNKKKEINKYGEYQNVFFTDEQYEKLINEFPNDYNSRIEKLDLYIQSTGKKYKDCLATIRNWARNENKKGNMNNGSNKKSDGSEFAEFS